MKTIECTVLIEFWHQFPQNEGCANLSFMDVCGVVEYSSIHF